MKDGVGFAASTPEVMVVVVMIDYVNQPALLLVLLPREASKPTAVEKL